MSIPASMKDGMNAAGGALGASMARVGLIISSSNRMVEPQFRHFAPPGLGVHVTRLRMAGRWKLTMPQLLEAAKGAAGALADAKADVIVFLGTGVAMSGGPEAERAIAEAIERETGVSALMSGQTMVEALRALALRRLVIVSPYPQATNDHERDYLTGIGFEVIHDVALGLGGGDEYIGVSPARWIEIVRENARDAADGYFLSCTNTTMIEAIADLEHALGKPIVNSNQAAIWACLRRLRGKLGTATLDPRLGQLAAIA